jgi:hypothetical protein
MRPARLQYNSPLYIVAAPVAQTETPHRRHANRWTKYPSFLHRVEPLDEVIRPNITFTSPIPGHPLGVGHVERLTWRDRFNVKAVTRLIFPCSSHAPVAHAVTSHKPLFCNETSRFDHLFEDQKVLNNPNVFHPFEGGAVAGWHRRSPNDFKSHLVSIYSGSNLKIRRRLPVKIRDCAQKGAAVTKRSPSIASRCMPSGMTAPRSRTHWRRPGGLS